MWDHAAWVDVAAVEGCVPSLKVTALLGCEGMLMDSTACGTASPFSWVATPFTDPFMCSFIELALSKKWAAFANRRPRDGMSRRARGKSQLRRRGERKWCLLVKKNGPRSQSRVVHAWTFMDKRVASCPWVFHALRDEQSTINKVGTHRGVADYDHMPRVFERAILSLHGHFKVAYIYWPRSTAPWQKINSQHFK